MIPFSASQEDDTRFSFVCVARYLHLFQLHKSLQQPQNAEGNTLPCCFTPLRVWLCSLLMMHLPSSCDTASGQCSPPSSSPSPFPALLGDTLSLPGLPGCDLTQTPSSDAGKDLSQENKEEKGSQSTTRLLFKLSVSYFIEAAEKEANPFSPPFPCAPQQPALSAG